MANPFEYTPICVKRLVQTIVMATLLSISLQDALPLIRLFSLNIEAFSSLYIWQFVTALFLIPSPDLSFSFLIDIFFSMVILYSAGKTVVFAYGKNHFFALFALGGISAGIVALIMMKLLNISYPFTETLPAVLAIVITWIMLVPYQNLALYFVVPIKSNWLFLIAFVGCVLMNAAQGDYIRALSYLTAILVGYLYSVVALGLSGPFTPMHPIEQKLKKLGAYLATIWHWKIKRLLE